MRITLADLTLYLNRTSGFYLDEASFQEALVSLSGPAAKIGAQSPAVIQRTAEMSGRIIRGRGLDGRGKRRVTHSARDQNVNRALSE